jgi:PAS domain S-box-containing protein
VEKKMIRVLHVDDEVSFLELSSFFLKREGDFEVETVGNAESALEKMQTQNYDAVVADYILPGMDGIEMLKIIRAKGLQIPLILFTGKGGEEAAVEALNYGADFYLQKGASPQIQFAELANMIRKSVGSTRSDEAVREGEKFLSSVFSSIQDGVSVLDRDLNIVRVNPAMENWYSHKMPLVGKKCYDAYHGRQAHCEVCPSLKTIENGKPAYDVVPKIGPRGEVVGWLDLFAFPMRDSRTGELSGVIEYVRDITDRRKAEMERHGALERYKELQGIIDKSPVILVLWRPEPGGPVSFISDSVAQWGYRRDDFVSTLVYDDIIHKEDIERERQEFRGFVSNGASDFVQEYRVVTKSGEVRWVEDHTFVRRDAKGNPTSYEGIVIDVTAREIAQQKSEELTSRLQAVVEAFPDLHFHLDAEGTILDYSASRVADLYVPPQKFLGRRMQEVLPPDVGDMFTDAMEEIAKTGRVLSREYSLEIQNETRFFEARFAPIPKGHVLAVVRNITDRKRAEEALLKSEEKYRTLFETDVQGVVYQNAKGEITSANPSAERILGLSLDQMQGVTSVDPRWQSVREDGSVFPGEEHPSMIALRTGREVQDVVMGVFNPKKGSHTWISINAIPQFRSGEDKPYQVYTTFDDLTERRLAGEALRASEEKYRQLIDLAQEGIMMTDAEVVISFANPRMAEMMGYPVHEVVGKSLFQLMDEHAADLVKRKIEDRRRGRSDRYELDFLRKDGTTVHTNIGVTAIMSKDGHYAGSLGVVTDISDRKRYEAALELANKKLNLLNEVTRHDALNQLSVLTGWLEVAHEIASEPQVQEYLKKMSNATETMRRQLDFTGDYQKMGITKPEWIEVKTAFLNGTEGFNPSDISKSIQVEGLEVLADTMLEKVFHNLVDDSFRHGHKTTKIGIRYEESDDRLLLIYEDNGIGIPKEEKKKLFQRGIGKHSGYGLFMVREILGITGMAIAEVGEPGKGVRFEITVPRGRYRFS